MAPSLSLKLNFATPSTSATNGDLVFTCTAEFGEAPLRAIPPSLKVSVTRKEGNLTRGHVGVLIPDSTGSLANARPVLDDPLGQLTDVVIDSSPQRTADSFIWRFFVTSQPGGQNTSLLLTAKAPPAPDFKAPQTPSTSARLPRPGGAPTALPLTPGEFPRFVVGIDTAKLPPSGLTGPFDATAARIGETLTRIFDRLTDARFEETVLTASLVAQSQFPVPKVVPSGAQAASMTVQDAEQAWANQVALMQLCTPYGGPNALYNLNDDDLLARTINGPKADGSKAVFPIVFACQHLGSFAVAARGSGLFKQTKAGRFLLLNAGATCASTWTSSKIGKWMTTSPDGSAPAESTDGGAGDPNLIAPNEALETSQLLFKIKDVATTHPFGSAAVFVYSNRPARTSDPCSIVGGVEICILKDKNGNPRIDEVPVFEEKEIVFVGGIKKKRKVLVKNADGTIKTVKQTARTTWAVSKFLPPPGIDGKQGRLLADNTAGAHLAYVLRIDNRTQLFQTFDTGGVNVPNRGSGVELVPPVDGFHGGIFDDPATDKVNPAATGPSAHDPFRGVGVIESINASQAKDLATHVNDVLKQARPMGLCRLVFLRRGVTINYNNYWRFKDPSQNFLIYASPAMPMYGAGDVTHNFPISRCLWALRDFPDAANVEAMWFFYVPQSALGQAMIDAPRTSTVRDLANAAFRLMKPGQQASYLDPKIGVKVSRLLADFCLPVLNATVEPDGLVKLVATYKTKLLRGRGLSLLHGLEGRYGSRSLLPLDQEFLRVGQSSGAFPTYFQPS
jgi:hypothetical protein